MVEELIEIQQEEEINKTNVEEEAYFFADYI